MTNLLQLAEDLKAQQQAYAAATRSLAAAKNELYDHIVDIVTDFGDVWSERRDSVTELVHSMGTAAGFQFSMEDYHENNLDEIVWTLGNHFPIYNESCVEIIDYPLHDANVADITCTTDKDTVTFAVSFTDMDDFECKVDKELLAAYFKAEDRKALIKEHMSAKLNTLLEELSKRFNRVKPKAAVASTKEARLKQLQEEAAELGMTLVSK